MLTFDAADTATPDVDIFAMMLYAITLTPFRFGRYAMRHDFATLYCFRFYAVFRAFFMPRYLF